MLFDRSSRFTKTTLVAGSYLPNNDKPVGKPPTGCALYRRDAASRSYQMALDHGFLTEAGYPTESRCGNPAVLPRDRYGVDTSVERGFTKIWTVFRRRYPCLRCAQFGLLIPPAARKYANFFAKHRLGRVSLVAIDFVSRHFNIYFMFPNPALNPPDRSAKLISDLDSTCLRKKNRLCFPNVPSFTSPFRGTPRLVSGLVSSYSTRRKPSSQHIYIPCSRACLPNSKASAIKPMLRSSRLIHCLHGDYLKI